MKNKAVICSYWAKSHAVILELAARQPCLILSFYSDFTEELRRKVESAGSRLIGLESLLSSDEVEQLRKQAVCTAEALKKAFSDKAWDSFCKDFQVSPDTLSEVLTPNIETMIHQMMVGIEALDRAHSQADIRLLAVNEEWTWTTKLLVLWAKDRGVPVLHLLHGVGLLRHYNIHGQVLADHFAVGSKCSEDGLLELGVDPDTVHVTGFPFWDNYGELIAQRDQTRAELADRFDLDPSLPWIAFFTTWTSPTSAVGDNNDYADGIRAILKACGPLWESGKRFQLIIKDRPNNAAFGRQVVETLITTLGVPPELVRHIDESASDLIAAASLVVSAGSNISVEAALAGVPAVNLTNTTQWLLGPPFGDTGLPDVDTTGLADWLSQHICAVDREFRAGLEPRDYFVGPNGDGGAAGRVADLMLQLAMVNSAKVGTPNPTPAPPSPWASDACESPFHADHNGATGREYLISLIKRPPNQVLDLRCGSGDLGAVVKRQWPTSIVVGIDGIKESVTAAQRQLDAAMCADLSKVNITSTGLPASSFDTILCDGVLEQLFNPWQFLIELRTLLTPKAQVIVRIPNVANAQLIRLLVRGGWDYHEDQRPSWAQLRFFGRTQVEQLFQETGYHIEALGCQFDSVTPDIDFSTNTKRDIELNELVLKNVSREHWRDLRTAFFVVRVSPRQ